MRPGAGLVATVAAGAAVLWVGHDGSGSGRPPTSAEVCVVAGQVAAAVDRTSLGARALVPARAAELADLLSRSGPATADPTAAMGIVAVLADDSATVDDLVRWLAPVSQRCGDVVTGD